MDVDNEIGRNIFAFVLTDIFRTQFHFTCFDVVTSLNECSIEHDAEHGLVGEASVFEHELDISLQKKALLLLLSQQEDNAVLLWTVLFLGRVCENLAYIKATTGVDFKVWHTATTWYSRHLDELHTAKALRSWWFDLTPEECLKVIEVAQLARLTHAFTASESHMAIELEALVHVFKITQEKEYRTYRCTCAPLTRVAMHYDHVFRIGYKQSV